MIEKNYREADRWNIIKRTGAIVSWIIGCEWIWLLLLCVAFRILYQYIYKGNTWWYSDTATYYYASLHILEGKVDAFRTPVYPLFLKLIELTSNERFFDNVVVMQTLISIISIVPFYLFCRQWFRSKYIVYCATILYGSLPVFLHYNRGICPESLLISSLPLLLYLISNYIIHPGYGKSVAMNGMMVFLVMLKPVCIYLYGVMGLLWILRYAYEKNSKLLRLDIAGIMVSVLLIAGYCLANKKQNGNFNISSVSHDNNFANIILSNAYKTVEDPTFISIIDSLKGEGHYYTVYYLNNDYYKYQRVYNKFPADYWYTRDMAGVLSIPPSQYNYSMAQLDSYIKKAMLSKKFLQYTIDRFTHFDRFKLSFIRGYVLYILLLAELSFVIYAAFYLRKVQWVGVFVFLALAGWIFTVLTTGINDVTMARVMVPALPFVIISMFGFVDKLIPVKFKVIK
jgi:hypothetical protein